MVIRQMNIMNKTNKVIVNDFQAHFFNKGKNINSIGEFNLMLNKIFIQQASYFCLFIAILFFPASQSIAVENITLQLKWTHQFQFAGYYAAIEKGYYKQKGLDITLVEGKPGENEVDEVISGRANFGVGMSDILLARLKGQSVVILANIFQHSASVLLAMKGSNISSPQDLFGKKIMMVPGYKSAGLQAMLANEGIPIDKVKILKPSWELNDLINGKVSAMASYISSAPYFLKKKDLSYVIISPISYGIDFYGDNLFTSEQEIKHHPNRVRAFKEASLKGWQYALKNPEEIIDIILLKYASGKENITKEFLINEASVYQKLILPDFVKIGHINPGRWKHIAETYVKLGMADKNYSLEGLIYNPAIAKFDWGHWAIKSGIGAILLAFGLITFLVFVNRRINKEIVVRKKAEKKSRENQELFKAIFEQTGGYCLLLQPTDNGIPNILDANEAACSAHGYTRKEIIGKPVADLDDEEGKELCRQRTKIIMSGKTLVVENDHVHKDGSLFPVAVYANRIDFEDRPPIIVSTEFDISDKRKVEAEKKILEIHLQQAQKMESIGKLAGGIAHEFNNILSIIIGNNELVMEELPKGSFARESTEEIRVAGMRASDVVKQLLTFSRQDNAAKKVMDLSFVVQESMKLIRSSTPANIEIQQILSDDVYPVLGNETQINQLLINLCNNAADAMPVAGPVMTIELLNEIVDEKYSKRHPALKPGQYVKLQVSDNGIGMDKNTIDRIFEPYYTTKEIGKGSGIGLAIVHGIVKRHGGSIIADSHPGQGSTFTLFFPAYEGPIEDKKDEDVILPTGDETILYVDDEPAIAKLGKRHLENLGYTAESTTAPLEALEMIKTDKDKFDLVISDMAMPSMTGDQLINEILKIRTDMPTIICTGYSAKFSKEEAANLGVSAFAMKPLNKSDLANIVRRVLDEAKGVHEK